MNSFLHLYIHYFIFSQIHFLLHELHCIIHSFEYADKGGPVFNIQPGQDGQFYAEQALQQQQLYADPQINLQNLGSQGKQEPA